MRERVRAAIPPDPGQAGSGAQKTCRLSTPLHTARKKK